LLQAVTFLHGNVFIYYAQKPSITNLSACVASVHNSWHLTCTRSRNYESALRLLCYAFTLTSRIRIFFFFRVFYLVRFYLKATSSLDKLNFCCRIVSFLYAIPFVRSFVRSVC